MSSLEWRESPAVATRLLGLAAACAASAPGAARGAEGGAGSPASADAAPDASPEGVRVGARLGYAFLPHARSLALEHNLRPALRLEALAPLQVGPGRLELGGGVFALLSGEQEYGVWSAQALLRNSWAFGGFELAAALGLGLGHNAPILYDDLSAGPPVVPYASLALQGLWALGERSWLGVELGGEQLGVLHLGAYVRWGLS